MKLLTKELETRFKTIGSQESKGKEAIVLAKFFDPCSNWTWYATEYNPNERLFFGRVDGFESELGYFSLDELEEFKGRLGLGIERDLYWDEKPLSQLTSND